MGHHEVVISQPSGSRALDGAAVKCTELAYRIAIAYFQPGRLARVFPVLCLIPQGTELENAIAATDARITFYDDVRADPSIIANFHMLFYD